MTDMGEGRGGAGNRAELERWGGHDRGMAPEASVRKGYMSSF